MVKGVSVHDISKFEDNQSMLGISLMLDMLMLNMGFENNSYFIQISRLALEIWLRLVKGASVDDISQIWRQLEHVEALLDA